MISYHAFAAYNVTVVNTRVFLEGPYNGANMNKTLNTLGLIPLVQPYSGAPWNYLGPETLTAVPVNVVDWILVQARSAPAVIAAQRAALILDNGLIVDLDGASPVRFWGLAAGNYYITLFHRNELAIMSALVQPLNNTSVLYDFTTGLGQCFPGGEPTPEKNLGGGVFGLWAGDVDHSGTINATDRALIQNAINAVATGYIPEDLTMDGKALNADLVMCQSSSGRETNVP